MSDASSCKLIQELFVHSIYDTAIKVSSATHTREVDLVSGSTLKVRSAEKSSLHFWSE